MSADDKIELKTWTDVIIHFLENSVPSSNLRKARETFDKEYKKLDEEKDTKNIARLKSTIDKKSKELNELRKKAPFSEIPNLIEKYSKEHISKGNRIVKTTHSLKFTHSSAHNAGVLVAERADDPILTTASLKQQRTFDYAHNNANKITIARFLALEFGGQSIYDCILACDFSFLKGFSQDEETLESWQSGLKDLIEDREINTAKLAKQIYQPVDASQNKYHILVPLFASTIAETIYRRVNETRFGTARRYRQLRTRNNDIEKYYGHSIEQFPNFAIFTFGGGNRQNISVLNFERSWKPNSNSKNTYGVAYLFNCAAPTWHSALTPPVSRKSLFFEPSISAATRTDIDYLRDFLLRFQKLDLSVNNPERKRWVVRWVSKIIDHIFFYISSIQEHEPSWSMSSGIKLKQAHQYLLDPYCNDSEFQAAKAAADWQQVICTDFAYWLNSKLAGPKKTFTPQDTHTKLWRELFEPELRACIEGIDLNSQRNTEART